MRCVRFVLGPEAIGPVASAPLMRYASPLPPASLTNNFETVEKRARLCFHCGNAQGADDPACCDDVPKQPERGGCEDLGEVLDFRREAQVWFVCAEPQHGVAWERRGNGGAVTCQSVNSRKRRKRVSRSQRRRPPARRKPFRGRAGRIRRGSGRRGRLRRGSRADLDVAIEADTISNCLNCWGGLRQRVKLPDRAGLARGNRARPRASYW